MFDRLYLTDSLDGSDLRDRLHRTCGATPCKENRAAPMVVDESVLKPSEVSARKSLDRGSINVSYRLAVKAIDMYPVVRVCYGRTQEIIKMYTHLARL